MEAFSVLVTLSLYVVAAIYLRRFIYSTEPSLLLKSIASIAFVVSSVLAYFLLLLFEKISEVTGSEFDLGHSNLLAVVVGMGVALASIVFVIITWTVFVIKRREISG